MSRRDKELNFKWNSFITPTGKDYISVRWTGYVQPAFSEVYTIYTQVNDGAKVWIDGELLIDAFETTVNDTNALGYIENIGTTSLALVAHRLYQIKVEYRENTGQGVLRMFWSSLSQPKAIVPTNRLFHTDLPIVGSED